jgi:hypothetical protein
LGTIDFLHCVKVQILLSSTSGAIKKLQNSWLGVLNETKWADIVDKTGGILRPMGRGNATNRAGLIMKRLKKCDKTGGCRFYRVRIPFRRAKFKRERGSEHGVHKSETAFEMRLNGRSKDRAWRRQGFGPVEMRPNGRHHKSVKQADEFLGRECDQTGGGKIGIAASYGAVDVIAT